MILLAALALAGELHRWDLDADDGGFQSYGETAQWAWGPVAAGPGAGWDGANAWAVGLSGPYLNDTVDYLELPSFDLSGAASPVLTFRHWYALAAGDAGWVEVDVGGGWTAVQPIYGYPTAQGWSGESEGWTLGAIDLAGFGTSPSVRLAFRADAAGVDDGWYVDAVGIYDGDVVPPKVAALDALPDTEDLDGPYLVGAAVSDDVAVASVSLRWSVDGGVEITTAMAPAGPDRWEGVIPGQAPGSVVSYRVAASDGQNQADHPVGDPLSFRVYLAAPEGLTAPEGRWVGTTVPLAWSAPDSRHPVLGYAVYRGTERVAETTASAADAPVTGGADVFTVRAVYEAGEGDPSEAVTVTAAMPTVDPLSPADGYPGDRLRVTVTGDYLLLADGEVEVSLGEGVTVERVDVREVDRAYVELAIAADAAAGPRDLTLAGPAGTLTVPGAFAVRADSDRPRLLALTPAAVPQGSGRTVTVSLVGPVQGEPVADLGEGVVVEALRVVDAETVELDVVVGWDAPLGQHALTLDDGVRIFGGVALEVEDVAIDPGRGCASVPGAPGLAGLLVAAGLARRRRGGAPRGRPGGRW